MDLAERVAAQRWYHTLELPGGVVTPGEYDLRAVAATLPWPALEGLRCLDVGSRDGFYAFEMERRGAAEVVSIDLDDPAGIDFPGPRPPDAAIAAELAAGNAAFELAHEALGSSVQRRHVSVYDLREGDVGRFDFAVLGTLLLHLRNPVGALMAIRGVTDRLLVNDAVHRTVLRRPLARLAPTTDQPFWWMLNAAALHRAVESAGFAVESSSRRYVVPWGPGRQAPAVFGGGLRQVPARLAMRRGAAHVWVLGS
jgi:tRNA (mo5U34)-methyltransferase